MKKIILFTLVLSAAVFGRQLSHPISAGGKGPTASSNDTLKVLAIMVQFQTDTDDRTSGNGQFDLGIAATPIIDAPPHDSAYFADHFVFAKNYFAKASNGRLHINSTVLGKVITLSKKMSEYAPIGGNAVLAQMVEESWKKADTLYPGFPFDRYDMFVVFHAGVGKDIDLRGALGYDPTPYDIPSLYFSLDGLKSAFGQTFTGFPVNNNAFSITNTVVLPETEVRSIPSIGDDIVLKLSINGLLVASIGSHLGLPDLFDTKTGRTAIGRFGLMDGQSIFSFAGICPPEPSAWEKTYLGWTTPVEIFGNTIVSLPAVGLSASGIDTVLKIPIGGKEYFLVENRQRDAKQNGQTVTMKWKGQTITKTFTRDEESFSNTNIDSIYGVVLDVDELDWSLPGLMNDNNNYHGGMLIWHIDESIIERRIATNSINADPKNRGVDLEEADGSQDIGQSYDLLSAGSGSEDGSPLDYWFNGNIAPVYKNEFSETTNPNSLTNVFARSHVTIKDFSASLPRMTVTVEVGNAEIQLVKMIRGLHVKQNNNDAPFAADLDGDGKEEIVYTSGDSIFALKNDLTPFLNNGTGLLYPAGGRFQPAFYVSGITGAAFARGLVGVGDSVLYLIRPTDGNADGTADLYRSIAIGDGISTPVVARDGISMGEFLVGTTSGSLAVCDTAAVILKIFSSPITTVASFAWTSNDSIKIENTALPTASPATSIAAINGELFVLTGNNISVYERSTHLLKRTIRLRGIATSSLCIVDINGDNNGDILLAVGNALYAYNANGSVSDHFPYVIASGDTIRGGIVSSGNHILFATQNGLLYAVDAKGKLVNGFPLLSGAMASAPFMGEQFVLAVSRDSVLSVWNHHSVFSSSANPWKTFLGSLSHVVDVTFSGPTIARSNEILPKALAYNWPNPVYSGSTNIRYYLGKEATVTITIINMAGELVGEMRGTSYVGVDNEVPWDISAIQSGIYYAHIKASGSSGEQSQIVKIAVVK